MRAADRARAGSASVRQRSMSTTASATGSCSRSATSAGGWPGFGARILNPDDVPKFLNSPQTPVFDKGRLLYGLDRARKPIRAAGPGGDRRRLPGCDRPAPGRFHQRGLADGHGADRAPAVPAQALQPAHRAGARPGCRRRKATLRGLQVARQAMDREQDPVFDARGLLRYEARLQADIRVTTLPTGWTRMRWSSATRRNGSTSVEERPPDGDPCDGDAGGRARPG